MQVTRFDLLEPALQGRLNSNTVARLDGVETFAEVLVALDELRAAHAPARILCTLDDVDQCAYTSGHASLDDRLWFDTDDSDDPATRHRADNARTAHIAAALDAGSIAWEALPGSRVGGEQDAAALVELNREPDQALDDVVLVQRVPVARDDLALAAVPNGYFTGDWDTFQNHAVVRRMAAHGYRHIGTGAELLAFDRESAPTPEAARAVVADLVHLYGASGSACWAELTALLAERRLLIIGYGEDFAEQLA